MIRSLAFCAFGLAAVLALGQQRPTVVARDVKQAYSELCQRDPEFAWATFSKRVEFVKVTSDEFDWTLSRMEQDEVYRL